MHYLKFLLKSSNQHGVHSPFVYDLVTNCFYKKNKASVGKFLFPKSFRLKHLEILNDFIAHANIKTTHICCKENHFIRELPNIKKQEKSQSQKADLIYASHEYFDKKLLDSLYSKLHSNSILIIELPYKNEKLWEKLKQQSITQIVVDTYFFGFIFTKTSQAKEEFLIRL